MKFSEPWTHAYLICQGPKSQVLGSNGGSHSRICLNLAVSRYSKSAVHIVVFQLHCSQKKPCVVIGGEFPCSGLVYQAWNMSKPLCIFRQFSSFIATNPLILVYWTSKSLITRLISLPQRHRLLCDKVAIKMEPTWKHSPVQVPIRQLSIWNL